MGAGRKGRRNTVDDPWSSLVEAPRANMPDPVKVVRRRTLARAVVWIVVGASVLSMVGLFSVLLNLRAAQQPASSDSFSLAKVAGTEAMQEWLSSEPAPMLNGRILTVDGVEPVTFDGADDKQAKFTVDVVTFTLVDSLGQLYQSGVQVAVDPRGSASAISTPSLEPIAAAANDGWNTGSPWPGLKTDAVPDPAKKAIEGWAAAYTSGDSDTLRLAVGDPDATHWYTPLAGVSKVTVEVMQGTSLTSSVMAAQVKLQLLWSGQQVPDGQELPTVTMDVLVERSDTAAPVVTAWGPAGTGPNLQRYGNAIDATGRANPTVSATPAASQSASPEPAASPTVTAGTSKG